MNAFEVALAEDLTYVGYPVVGPTNQLQSRRRKHDPLMLTEPTPPIYAVSPANVQKSIEITFVSFAFYGEHSEAQRSWPRSLNHHIR